MYAQPHPTGLTLRREQHEGRELLTFVTDLARFSIPIERVPELLAALAEFAPSSPTQRA